MTNSAIAKLEEQLTMSGAIEKVVSVDLWFVVIASYGLHELYLTFFKIKIQTPFEKTTFCWKRPFLPGIQNRFFALTFLFVNFINKVGNKSYR